MRDYHILVAGPEAAASSVVRALRERHLSAWSDRTERVLRDRVSLNWADVVVVFREEGLLERQREHLDTIRCPKLLLSCEPLSTEQRAELVDAYGFEFVIAWPAPADLIAAFVERAAHRRALPLGFSVPV